MSKHISGSIITISLIGFAISATLLATAPTPQVSPFQETPLPLSVQDIKLVDVTPTFSVFGRAIAPYQLELVAQVSGNITALSSSFSLGNTLPIGEMVYQIDTTSLKQQLVAAQSQLQIAQADLSIEHGEQYAAKREYQQALNNSNSKKNSLQKQLMLRQPQLQKMQARVALAQNTIDQINQQIDYSHQYTDSALTVTEKQVNIGNYVTQGQKLGTLTNIDQLEIDVTVPATIAQHLKQGETVRIVSQQNISSQASISRISPQLSQDTQLQKIHLSIDNKERIILLNEFLTVEILLPTLTNVIAVPAKSVDKDKLWLVNRQNTLESVKVTTLWQENGFIYINNTLPSAARIVTSKLNNASDGKQVNIVEGVI